MAPGDTVEKILHAASVLFAERGFAETSLRTITGMADVNLAAVNYHFGSKKELIQAVFSRVLQPFCLHLNTELDRALNSTKGQVLGIEQILDSCSRALLNTTHESGMSVQRVMRLLSLAYTQNQEHLRQYIVGAYGETYERFAALLQRAAPGLSLVEFYWKLYFMLGAAVFTLSSFDSLRAILNSDYQQDTELEGVLELMIPSLSTILVSGKE
ncbi:transcriptional regulator, TetR family [Alteromonadaceae bacterium Bs31]|nr:transcriptional regulator, TetR family [Alteromonadaceae bacterium Bs31]